MGAIEKDMSFRERHWRFLMDPPDTATKALLESISLGRPGDLLVCQPSPTTRRLEIGGTFAIAYCWLPDPSGYNEFPKNLSLL